MLPGSSRSLCTIQLHIASSDHPLDFSQQLRNQLQHATTSCSSVDFPIDLPARQLTCDKRRRPTFSDRQSCGPVDVKLTKYRHHANVGSCSRHQCCLRSSLHVIRACAGSLRCSSQPSQFLGTEQTFVQIASRKSVFLDRTEELARRAAGPDGNFYSRYRTS